MRRDKNPSPPTPRPGTPGRGGLLAQKLSGRGPMNHDTTSRTDEPSEPPTRQLVPPAADAEEPTTRVFDLPPAELVLPEEPTAILPIDRPRRSSRLLPIIIFAGGALVGAGLLAVFLVVKG